MARFDDSDDMPRRVGRKKSGKKKKQANGGLLVGTLLGGLVVAGGVFGGILFLKNRPAGGPGDAGGDKPSQVVQTPAGPLGNAVSEADRLDPGWKLEQMVAKRAASSGRDDSTQVITEANRQVSRQAGPTPGFVQKPLFQPLTEQQKGELSLWLRHNAAALKVAETLATKPVGLFPIPTAPDFISAVLVNEQAAQTVGNLLVGEAILKAESRTPGKLDEFVGVMHAVQSIGEEPISLAQLMRNGLVNRAVYGLERTLGKSAPSAEALGKASEALAQVSRGNYILAALRGERAAAYGFAEVIDSGKVPVAKAEELIRMAKPGFAWPADEKPGSAKFQAAMALQLQTCTALVEAGKKPMPEQMAAIQGILAIFREKAKQAPSFLHEMTFFLDARNVATVHRELLREEALRRCALAGIAAERHRLATGQWPTELSAIGKDLLAEVPTDPFNGMAVHFKRLEDGVVVYSVGPNGKDDQGDLGARNDSAADVGFRLVDAAKRR